MSNLENSNGMTYLLEAMVSYTSLDKEVQEILRFTQYLFNKLSMDRPDIADKIVRTANDFFYDDLLSLNKWSVVCGMFNEEI